MEKGRKKLRILAKERLLDAKALLGRRRYGGAYYLNGYAVELALKSRILTHFGESDVVFGIGPAKTQFSEYRIHDLVALVKLGNLTAELAEAESESPEFSTCWSIAKDWKETSRYELIDPDKAKAIYNSVSDPTNGVFKWIQKHW